MFDPAALSLISALNIATGAGNAVMLENTGSAGGLAETPQTGGFGALLTLQSAKTSAPGPTDPVAVPPVAKPAFPAIAQPATGKSLPDAAMPLAAIAGRVVETADISEDEAEVAALAVPEAIAIVPCALLPDPALIAAIFAAPDRLARASDDSPRPAPSPVRADSLPVTPARPALAEPTPNLHLPLIESPPATQKQPQVAQPALAARVALAQTAAIELAPPAAAARIADEPVPAATLPVPIIGQPTTAATLTHRAPIAATPMRTAATAKEPGVDQPHTMAATAMPVAAIQDEPTDALPPPAMQDTPAPVGHRAAEAAPVQESAPATRAEPRAERIDFATLVETLNRAREDAAPNTVRVSVAHADFGRVSMRFEQDDTGLSVAMSSADPGFARAVAASNDTAQPQTATDTPRGQSSQANTGGTAQGESNRQPQGQRGATPDRPAAQLRDTLRRDDEPGSSGGIFA